MKPKPDSQPVNCLWLCLLALAVTQFEDAATADPIEGLTLEQALEQAERLEPQLAEAMARVEAATGRAEQAGALPNPELILGAQQLPLDRGASNQREYVAGVAQPIPVCGRLRKAREAELMEREVRLRGLEVPTMETLAASLDSQPEVLQAEASLRASSAWLELAKSERIPDLKVEALYHRLEATEENTMDLGISIPLPLFNRNQGRLREARAESVAAQARARMTQNEVTARLQTAYVQLTSALANSRTFKSQVMPRAEKVFRTAEARYAAGDTSLIEFLPVGRDWAAIRIRYLESLRDVMLAWGEVRDYIMTR